MKFLSFASQAGRAWLTGSGYVGNARAQSRTPPTPTRDG